MLCGFVIVLLCGRLVLLMRFGISDRVCIFVVVGSGLCTVVVVMNPLWWEIGILCWWLKEEGCILLLLSFPTCGVYLQGCFVVLLKACISTLTHNSSLLVHLKLGSLVLC